MFQKLVNYIVGAFVALSLTAGSAMAALPAAVTDATNGPFVTLKNDVMSLVDLAWTAAVPITVAFIILRLFKRAAGSAV